MGETKYPSSLIYPVKELCTGSETLHRNIMEDNNCQILINGDHTTKSRLSISFPNRVLIESGSDVNLLEGDNSMKEESMDKFYRGKSLNTSKFARRCLLKLQQPSTPFKRHETYEILVNNKEDIFLYLKNPQNQQGSTQLGRPHTRVRVIGELKQRD
ncbi:hypothetical protein GW17_00011313 [Ensete ventricosum]|nr:hypothetical protein GW17_00011313 [Ensete ventricosum]RZR84029.1 hypothetical protein BHM03_00010775 [Ensete ventricosum]